MKARLTTLLLASGVVACSGILGLTDPQEFPPDGGVSPGTSGGSSSSGGDANSSSSSGGLRDADIPCGRSCGRGTCEANRCQPFLVGQIPLPPPTTFFVTTDLVHDDGYLYVSASNIGYRIDKKTGEITTFSTAKVTRLVRGGPKLYFSTTVSSSGPGAPPSGTIRSCDLPACKAYRDLADIGTVSALEFGNGFGGQDAVAWIDNLNHTLSVPSLGSAPTNLVTDLASSFHLHLFGDALYWPESKKTLSRLKRGETTPVSWDTAPYQLSDFAIAGTDVVFYSNRGDGGAIAHGKLGDGILTDVKDAGELPNYNVLLVPDATTLYIRATDGIRTCPFPACDSLTMHTPAPPPLDGGFLPALHAFDVDGDTLWFTLADGRVMGVAK